MLTAMVSALVGLVSSIIVAFVTTRLNAKIERQKFERQLDLEKKKMAEAAEQERSKFFDDLAIRYAEVRSKSPEFAQSLAIQYAVGVLSVLREGDPHSQKYFVPQNLTLSIGRGLNNDIILQDEERMISAQHCAVISKGKTVYVADYSTNGLKINGGDWLGRGQLNELKSGDIVGVGSYEIRFDRFSDVLPKGAERTPGAA